MFIYADLEVCAPAFEVFMGVPVSERPVDLFTLVPDEESWSRGDRRLMRGAYDETGAIGTAASAGLPAPGLRVLGVSNLTDQVDLCLSAEGTELEAITNDPEEGVISPPGIGPDGRVGYARYPLGDTSQADILASEPSGEIATLLATPADEGSTQLSPDGSKIVYRARHDGVSNIWIMIADGSDARELNYDPAGDFEFPGWTADGAGIAFTSNRIDLRIWIMGADGSEQTLFSIDGPSGYGTAIGLLR